MATTNQEFRKKEHEHLSYFNLSPVRCLNIQYIIGNNNMVIIIWAISNEFDMEKSMFLGENFDNFFFEGFQRSNTLSSVCS